MSVKSGAATNGAEDTFYKQNMNNMKYLALALLLIALPATASAQSGCSKETLTVRGTPVAIAYCLLSPPTKAAGSELVVPVSATYSANGDTISDKPVLRFIAAEGPSRVIQDVALAKLGIDGTLHLTLVFRGGAVSIESALLTPGAITIK